MGNPRTTTDTAVLWLFRLFRDKLTSVRWKFFTRTHRIEKTYLEQYSRDQYFNFVRFRRCSRPRMIDATFRFRAPTPPPPTPTYIGPFHITFVGHHRFKSYTKTKKFWRECLIGWGLSFVKIDSCNSYYEIAWHYSMHTPAAELRRSNYCFVRLDCIMSLKNYWMGYKQAGKFPPGKFFNDNSLKANLQHFHHIFGSNIVRVTDNENQRLHFEVIQLDIWTGNPSLRLRKGGFRGPTPCTNEKIVVFRSPKMRRLIDIWIVFVERESKKRTR